MSASIDAITQSVSRVKALVDDVSEASKQQSQGIDQVSQAVAQIEKVTQSTAATAEESAAASEELSAQAETSLSEIASLEAMVTRVGADRPSAKPAPQTEPSGRIVQMASGKPASARPSPSAEEQIPLGDTGTYGRF